METGIGDIRTAVLAALPPERAAALCEAVTIDLDTTDVEGQRCGRPHLVARFEDLTDKNLPAAPVLAAEVLTRAAG